QLGQEQLPHAGLATDAHRVTAAVPLVEIADDAHPLGIRRPNRKNCPVYARDRLRIGAEETVCRGVRAGIKTRQVSLVRQRREGVRVVLRAPVAEAVVDQQAIMVRNIAYVADELE